MSWEVDEQFFDRAFRSWVEREQPSIDLRFVVVEWVHGLQSDPFLRARPVQDFGDDWWFARIRDSNTGQYVVTAVFFADPEYKLVQISVLATLGFPI